MKKSYLWIFILLTILVGCSSNQEGVIDDENHEDTLTILADNVIDRKIIYSVNARFNVDIIETASNHILAKLEQDEWVDFQTIQSSYASFVLRIKTDRLDDFIQDLKEDYVFTHYEKRAKDISLQYQDKSDRILSIEAQITRLQALYQNATLTEMLTINAQLSDLEVELQRLNGEIASFDSLIDYSEVSLTIYGNRITTRSPFINRVGQAFMSGATGLIRFLDGLVIVFITILPFGLVFGGVGLGVYGFIKRVNKKRDLKKAHKD